METPESHNLSKEHISKHKTMLPLELTLVLAATRDMGIGLNGALPWTGLKKEMAYFARVTKRLPPHVCPSSISSVTSFSPH
jgi:hypothetical protein